MVRPMQEFSSISVSSYDAASLADKLTEKSGDGWGVVSIVAAGTNVTAYLSRERDQAAGDLTEAQAEAPVADVAADEPSFEPVLPAAAATTVTPGPAVEEPAGWAVEPEPVSTAAAAAATTEATTWGSGATTETQQATQPAAEPEPEPEPVAAQQATEAAAAAQTAQTSQASAATAPAGWYADPSGRYELRYWDGTQWTEHVSRAGQQYTDPPVA
jgi:Protein of unknown function (DUF2510)